MIDSSTLAGSGEVYEGEWKNDQKDGYGTYRTAAGNVYTGQYRANMREGRGIEKFADGASVSEICAFVKSLADGAHDNSV